MKPKKSAIWNYFIVLDANSAECVICRKRYSRQGRSPTPLKMHLKSMHYELYLEYIELQAKGYQWTPAQTANSKHNNENIETRSLLAKTNDKSNVLLHADPLKTEELTQDQPVVDSNLLDTLPEINGADFNEKLTQDIEAATAANAEELKSKAPHTRSATQLKARKAALKRKSDTANKLDVALKLLKKQVLESELYKNKLEILRLERLLGLASSKFTANF